MTNNKTHFTLGSEGLGERGTLQRGFLPGKANSSHSLGRATLCVGHGNLGALPAGKGKAMGVSGAAKPPKFNPALHFFSCSRANRCGVGIKG